MVDLILWGLLFGTFGYIIGFGSGWKRREQVAIQKIAEFESLQKQEQQCTILAVTRENGVLYAYNEETNEFLAQGETLNDVRQHLKQRFPTGHFAVRKENIDKLGLTLEDDK